MNTDSQRIAIAEACGWRRWRFGDPYLEGLLLADKRFDGFVRRVTRVYPEGVTLNVDESPLYSFDEIRQNFVPVNFWLTTDGKWHKCLPNYLNDLNAMHEAEKTLTDEQWRVFGEHLTKIVSSPHGYGFHLYTKYPWSGDDVATLAHATAAQRAEAFLRTLNKWDDTK